MEILSRKHNNLWGIGSYSLRDGDRLEILSRKHNNLWGIGSYSLRDGDRLEIGTHKDNLCAEIRVPIHLGTAIDWK